MNDYSRIDSYVLRLVKESTPEKTMWNLEKIRAGKKGTWNYIDGCMLTALMEMTRITNDPCYEEFAGTVADYYVQPDGEILTLDPDQANLDDINEGRILFELFEKTGNEKYRLAAERLYRQLEAQPRTYEGNFWHKAIYPEQVWLDGIYMAQPFRALFEKHFGSHDYSDIVRQITTVNKRMRNPETGLYYHGYDASKTIFWADPETGCSKNYWLRSLGWFAVALADLSEIIPEGSGRDTLAEIFADLMQSMLKYADEETGMYWQVPDQPHKEGNYLETSGSAMMAYAMLKGSRLGILDETYAEAGEKTFRGIMDKYLKFTDTGIDLGGICLVAGLGPAGNTRRDGSYEYYISEPIVENDAKGVAPFILAYTEVKRRNAA